MFRLGAKTPNCSEALRPAQPLEHTGPQCSTVSATSLETSSIGPGAQQQYCHVNSCSHFGNGRAALQGMEQKFHPWVSLLGNENICLCKN